MNPILLAAEEEHALNPLIPHPIEMILSLVVFGLLYLAVKKWVVPSFEKTFAERTSAIEGGLAAAETKQAEADAKLAELNQQLSEARHEAARIREEAREQGATIVAEMREQGQAESARIVADSLELDDPAAAQAWIAEVDGEPAGCVFCVPKESGVAQLRLLLVEPRARGMGIGERLVDECMRFARDAGYRRLVLWTNDVLVSARRLYQRAGFRLAEETPFHGFGHDLVSQVWVLDLAEADASSGTLAG